MDQRGDRGRALHGVGQPGVERNLRRLTGRTDEQQNRYGSDAASEDRSPSERVLRHLSEQIQSARDVSSVDRFVIERDRTGQRKDEKYSHQDAPVTDTVHYECLFSGTAGFVAFDVITDQEIRAKTDAFPTNEHQQEVIRQNESQHREHEQVQIRKEAVKALVAVHVTRREYMDQEPDKRDKTRVNA